MDALLADYHMHLENGRLEADYLAAFRKNAEDAGLSGFGISEHLHNLDEGPRLLKRPMPEGVSSLGWNTDRYIRTVKAAGFAAGLEADYIPESENELRDYLISHDFDYVIGSVHWLDDWVFDLSPALWSGMDVEDAWRRYFKTAVKAVNTGMFDIFGHPDVIKVFGMKPGVAFEDELHSLYRELAKAAASAGTCLEVSSAGLRKPCGELYPDISLLREAKSAGATISFGSDAHYPEHVAYRFDRLAEHARSAGFDRAAVLVNGNMEQKAF